MRRLSVHALAVGVLVLAVLVLAAGLLTSPTSTTKAVGEPRTDPSATTPASSAGPSTRTSRADRISRDVERPAFAALLATRTATQRRAAALERQERLIAARSAALAKQREERRKKAAAAAKARQRAIAKLGYTPGTRDPRSIARQIMQNKYGYGAGEFACFNNIIMRESMWDVHATNVGSGAYGIPQSLPGTKMASVAPDWRTNPATQIIWGIQYMKSTYGSPCAAWSFKSGHGWY